MTMKKIFMTMAVCFCALTASAQGWGLGARIGSGFQAQGEYTFSNDNYVDARFGMSWCNAGATLMADFTALYQWNVCKMQWTPSAGEWFFDAGAGVGVGGREHYAYVGVAGCAKLGIKFNNAPVKLSIDWTPVIGPQIDYYKGASNAAFHEYGLANLGISAVYCF